MSTLQELERARARIADTLVMMKQAQNDMERFGTEGSYYAGLAASWAAVLMVADVLKLVLSEEDKRAAFVFVGMDRALQQVNKLLITFNCTPIPQKSDALNSLDSDMRKVSTWSDHVSNTSKWLLKLGSPGSKEARGQMSLVIQLAQVMAQDTLLMLQAGRDQNRIASVTRSSLQNATSQMRRVQGALAKIDAEIQARQRNSTAAGREDGRASSSRTSP